MPLNLWTKVHSNLLIYSLRGRDKLPLNPRDFLKLAERLYKDENYQDINEAKLRTAVSRSYYAAFLILRETLKEELTNTQLSEYFKAIYRSGAIHGCVKKILDEIDNFLGKLYGKLRKERNLADYDLNKSITPEDVEYIIEVAKKIIEQAPNLSIEPSRISDIIVKYYNRINKDKQITNAW